MKIYNYKLNVILKPYILVNVSGNIIHFNNDAEKAFKVKIGMEASHLIDINEIRKFSMYSDKIKILETLHPVYKYAIVSISGSGLNKILKVSFETNIGENEEQLKKEKDILFVANDVVVNKKVSMVSLIDEAARIKELFLSKGHFLNTYVKINEPVKVNSSRIQALIVCAVAMMNEASPKRPVDLYIKRDMNNLIEIKVLVRVDTMLEKYTEQEIESVFPKSTIRIALINKICEEHEINYNMSIAEKTLRVVYKIKEEYIANITISSIGSHGLSLEELYSLLSPRVELL